MHWVGAALGVVVAFLLGLQFRASPLASEIASIEGAAASGAESNREGVRP